MQLIRQYKNAAGDDLRFDIITMTRMGSTMVSDASTHTFKRHVKTTPVYNSGVADRDVATIEVTGDFDDFDTTDFKWATWSSPVARLDMSDLPAVGATV